MWRNLLDCDAPERMKNRKLDSLLYIFRGEKDMKRIPSKLTGAFAVLLLCVAAVTTANSQENPTKAIDLNALAARGEALANEDPLALELRNQQPEGPARHGFDIGMAVAEGHTLPGPGKDRTCASLPPPEPTGCRN